jgi:hypothetical protein
MLTRERDRRPSSAPMRRLPPIDLVKDAGLADALAKVNAITSERQEAERTVAALRTEELPRAVERDRQALGEWLAGDNRTGKRPGDEHESKARKALEAAAREFEGLKAAEEQVRTVLIELVERRRPELLEALAAREEELRAELAQQVQAWGATRHALDDVRNLVRWTSAFPAGKGYTSSTPMIAGLSRSDGGALAGDVFTALLEDAASPTKGSRERGPEDEDQEDEEA